MKDRMIGRYVIRFERDVLRWTVFEGRFEVFTDRSLTLCEWWARSADEAEQAAKRHMQATGRVQAPLISPFE